jgi:MFS family permease
MALPAKPPLASSYAANVVLVILTLFPGLINTSAIALAAPVIGGDLGVAANVAAALPLLSDAALAFGCVLGAELARRCARRVVYFWLIAVSLATSLASAIAPTFAVLLVAHVVHGLVAGMLFIVILPPLLTSFGGAKLRATATVMVPALFGAATLGPLLGGLVAAPGAWRSIFAAEVVVAAIAYGLAPFVLERGAAPAAEDPIDWFALIFAALGSSFVYVGVGALAGSDWRNPAATGPVAIGLLLYAALVAGEAVKRRPLAPVRELATSVALIGTIATVIGSATFAALTQGFALTLLRVDGLTPRATGLAFWPEFLAALASGLLFGRLVMTRWVVLCGAAGLVCIAVAAAIARALAAVTPGEVGWLCAIAGFGAGLSVSPGLFLIALSFERQLVGRAVALLNLFRLTGGFISAPGVEHTIGSRAAAHLRALDPTVAATKADLAVRAFATGAHPPPAPIAEDLLRRALSLGIADAYWIIVALALAGTTAIVGLIAAAHVPLRAPDLARFDAGKPALDAGAASDP